MHLLYHARPGVAGIWVLAGHWMMTWGQAVLGDALMGSERLRHHHCGEATTDKGFVRGNLATVTTKRPDEVGL